MRLRFQRFKELGLIAFGVIAILWAIYELYRAAVKGVVDAPIGPARTFVLVTAQQHPYWFYFSIAVNGVAALMGIFMIIFGFWNNWSTARRIKQKYPMRNRW